jgi:hypothetical protein
MPAAEPPVVSSESGLLNMDDRKRPATDSNDSAPPLKKQATTVNGGSKPHPDADMPWKDDLEVCARCLNWVDNLFQASKGIAHQYLECGADSCLFL